MLTDRRFPSPTSSCVGDAKPSALPAVFNKQQSSVRGYCSIVTLSKALQTGDTHDPPVSQKLNFQVELVVAAFLSCFRPNILPERGPKCRKYLPYLLFRNAHPSIENRGSAHAQRRTRRPEGRKQGYWCNHIVVASSLPNADAYFLILSKILRILRAHTSRPCQSRKHKIAARHAPQLVSPSVFPTLIRASLNPLVRPRQRTENRGTEGWSSRP